MTAGSPAPRAAASGTAGAAPGSPATPGRPTAAELAAARDQTIPDVAAARLRVLFCGINPSLYSAATGYHFARPGNRFWPALHQSGFTPRLLDPREQHLLPGLGLGITNVVARATARAEDLAEGELLAGGEILRAKVAELAPAWLAVAGVTAYRQAFGKKKAVTGPQDAVIGGTRVWVLPNPSGLNAHKTLPMLAADFRELREAAEAAAGPS